MNLYRWGRVAAVAGVGLALLAGAASCSGGAPQVATAPNQTSPTISIPTLEFSSPTTMPTTTTPRPTPTTTQTTPSEAPLTAENRTVTRNPVYRLKLPASRCKEPAERATSTSAVRSYYAKYLRCLDKAWAPVIRQAGYTFRPARLVVYNGTKPADACTIADSASYCNGVISMNAAYDINNRRSSDPVWTRSTMAFLIAHEYGHHVQSLTGIMQASWSRQLANPVAASQLVENRRRELQASCFSGLYLGANKRYFPATGRFLEQWLWTVRNRGDEWNPRRTHGKKTNHGTWSRRGFADPTIGSCNTFTASAAAVG